MTLLHSFFEKFGVSISFVPAADPEAWEQAAREETALIFCETPSNPLLEIVDVRALARLARSTRSLLVVDNTFCTPCGQNPLALGASLVLHSASKYIDGQGRCLGGAIVGPATLIARLRAFMRCAGPALGAHNAWILLKGLETLQLRMERHCANARTIAVWLSEHPRITAVHYTGLPTHPQYALARTQQRRDGGVLSYRPNVFLDFSGFTSALHPGGWREQLKQLFRLDINPARTGRSRASPARTRICSSSCSRPLGPWPNSTSSKSTPSCTATSSGC